MSYPEQWDRMGHRVYAAALGYFWLPCPRCGTEFGGHEAGENTIPDPSGEPGRGLMVCKKCSDEVGHDEAR
jgi:hypothetical protein